MKQKQPYDAYYMRTSHFLQNIITQVEQIPEGAVVFKDEGVSGRIEFQQRKAGGKLIEEIKAGRVRSPTAHVISTSSCHSTAARVDITTWSGGFI